MQPLPLTVLNTLVCILYIIFTIRSMVAVGKLRLLHLSSIAVVLTNGLGIPFTTLSQDIGFTKSATPEVAWVAFLSMAVFIALSFLCQLQAFYKDSAYVLTANLIPQKKLKPNLWFWLIFLLSIGGIGKFMFIDGGFSFLGSILLSFGDLVIYYATRKEIGETIIKPGQGYVIVVTSMNYLLPMIALLSSYYAKPRKLIKTNKFLYVMTGGGAIALIAIVAFTLAQRFMFAYLIILIANCWLVYKYQGNLELLFLKWKKPYLVLSILTALLLSIGWMMSVIAGVELLDGIILLLDRIFLIPAGTSSYYYYLFPERFPYRGILNSFQMLVTYPSSTEIGTRDIALAITDGFYEYNPNACFLATAFSGANFLGVLLVSCVYCFFASAADRLLNRLEPNLRFIGILINLYGIVGVTSTPLYACLTSYGFGISTFAFYLLIKQKHRLKAVHAVRVATNK